MLNVKIKGKKNGKTVFFFVVAQDLKEAIELAEGAALVGFSNANAGKRLDKITSLEIVDDNVVISDKIWNVKKFGLHIKEKPKKD